MFGVWLYTTKSVINGMLAWDHLQIVIFFYEGALILFSVTIKRTHDKKKDGVKKSKLFLRSIIIEWHWFERLDRA